MSSAETLFRGLAAKQEFGYEAEKTFRTPARLPKMDGKGLAMRILEETIAATLDSNGQLHLIQPPQLPPGPVRVTIRVAAPVGPRRGMADVIQEIDADQRLRGFHGR